MARFATPDMSILCECILPAVIDGRKVKTFNRYSRRGNSHVVDGYFYVPASVPNYRVPFETAKHVRFSPEFFRSAA